MVLQPEV